MARARFHLLDVFTARPFTGNPLAVFVDPPELTDGQMQTIAREMNLSETVFVRTPDATGGSWPTRIFTPATELPFAGHPTIGTAVLLAELGLARDRCVLSEGVGDVAVTISEGPVTSATLRTAMPPQFTEGNEWDRLARVLSIATSDLHPKLAPAIWSCGVPYWIVPVRDAEVLARTWLDLALWNADFAFGAGHGVYVMTPLDGAADRWRARMYAPDVGVAEDPATGSAAAACAGFLAGSRQWHQGPMRWVIEQGVEMGRPSEIRVELEQDGSEVTAVLVGGEAVVVGEGQLALPLS